MMRRSLALAVAVLAAAISTPTAAGVPTVDRPEGPLLEQPNAGKVVRTAKVLFRWRSVPHALAYDVRIARDSEFRRGMKTFRVKRPGTRLSLDPGRWHWKVRSVGPQIESRWSDNRQFRLRPSRDIIPPVRPLKLRVVKQGEFRVKLAFRRAIDRSGIKRYRVFANGKRVANPRGTRVSRKRRTVVVRKLQCGTVYTFRVKAVDRVGNVSAASPRARARTRPCSDVLPPDAVATPAVTAVTDTTVALSWAKGTDSDGEVVGYAVYRDGTLLGMPVSNGYVAKNLSPATQYTFTVVVRDRARHFSDASPPLTVTTALPIPATGPAYAYLLASTDSSFHDFQTHYQQIETVSPTYFDINRNGTIRGEDDPLITNWARLRGVHIEPRFNTQDPVTQAQILPNPTRRSALVSAIAGIVARHGYDGANLDVEAGSHTLRDDYTAFVDELANVLHAQGATLTINVSAKTRETFTGRSGFYDYPALATRADRLFVLSWDLHWATGPSGPISDVRWVTDIADYVKTLPNSERFILGTNLYGFDWPEGGTASAFDYDSIVALRGAVSASEQWHAGAKEPFFTYTDSNGQPHSVWYANAISVEARLAVARERGLGVGLWRLGQEDQSVWSILSLQP